MTFRRSPLLLGIQLALLVAATPTLAAANADAAPAEKDIEVMVITAAGFEQKLVYAPASVSVISAAELAGKPYLTLLDAVRELEGVDIGETRDKTGQGTISLRGMGSDYTLILVDGKRQNNHGDIYPNSFGGNQFGHMPALDAVERIELIRGPASTLYGADAMGGVINIITKKVTNDWHGSVSHSRTVQLDDDFGDDITTDFYSAGALIDNTLGLALRGSFYNRLASNPNYAPVNYPNGQTQIRSLGFGAGGKTVDNDNKTIGARLSFTPNSQQSFWFDIDRSTQEYDNTPVLNDNGSREYPVGTVDNISSIWQAGNFCRGASGNNQNACRSNGGVWSRRANPQVGYSATQEFSRDSWSLSHEGNWAFGNSFVSLSYVDTQNHGRTLPFSIAERARLLEIIDAKGQYAGLSEAARKALAEQQFLPRPKRVMASDQFTLDGKLDSSFDYAGRHTLVSGFQVIRGELEDSVFGLESGTPGMTQDHNMWALFAEDNWDVTEDVALTMGLRRDEHEVFGGQFSPRIYAVYSLNEQWTIKGGVATGFKTPKTTQLYDGVVGFGGQGTSPMFGNPDLQPETSQSAEIAAYWQHDAGHNFNATLFKNDFDDKLSSQPCGPGSNIQCASSGEYAAIGYANSNKTVNIDKVVIQGAELAGRWQFSDTLSLNGNYTFTDSEQKSGANKGLPLNNTAKHMANLTLNWDVTAAFGLFLTGESRDKRYRSFDTVKQQELYYKAYNVLHLGARYQLSDAVTLNARVNNLLDEDFTGYDLTFTECSSGTSCVLDASGQNGYQASFLDHHNNKDKARNLWLGVNVKF